MAQIPRFLHHGTATFGSLNRWEKLGFFLCFSCVSACIAQLAIPVAKSLVVLFLVTGTADRLWSSPFCSGCGNGHHRDLGSNTIATLCWCDRPEMAVELLGAMLKKDRTQLNWPMASNHLRTIDREGKISGARWLESCRPFAEHQNRVLEAQHTEVGNAYFYRRPATFSLIAGYANHGCLSDCESWYKKLIAKEEEVRGKESFSVREVLLKLADFYVKHNRRADADKVMEQLNVMAMHPDKYGDRWRLELLVGGKYRFVRVVSD
ncbi:MAG: hypothetical protein C0473_01435 [Cyanobacteria bacterium DS3.002]|nr:hypothetical protein [Cyanobacteria bacterium DS3.002]MBA4049580.1 hypothetical protein [Cyanobacteria bacterium DS2.008]